MPSCCERLARAQGLFLIGLSACGFNVQSAFVHFLGEDVCALQAAAVRGVVAWLITAAFLCYTYGSRPTLAEWFGSSEARWWLFIRGITGAGANIFAFLAFSDKGSLGDATALAFTAPFFTAVYAVVLLGERPSFLVTSAIVMGVAGAFLVAKPSFLGLDSSSKLIDERPDQETGSGRRMSSAFALGSAIIGGLVWVSLRRLRDEKLLAVMNWQMISEGLVSMVLIPPTCGFRWQMPAVNWAMLASCGVIAFFAQSAATIGTRMQNAAAGSGMRTLDVFNAYIIQLVAFPDDPVDALSLLGSGLIVIGVLLIVIERLFCPTLDNGPAEPLAPVDDSESLDKPEQEEDAATGDLEEVGEQTKNKKIGAGIKKQLKATIASSGLARGKTKAKEDDSDELVYLAAVGSEPPAKIVGKVPSLASSDADVGEVGA